MIKKNKVVIKVLAIDSCCQRYRVCPFAIKMLRKILVRRHPVTLRIILKEVKRATFSHDDWLYV